MQLKTTNRYSSTSIRIAKMKKNWPIPSVGEDLEQLPLSHIAERSINWYKHFKNYFADQVRNHVQSKTCKNNHSTTTHNS